MSEDATLDKFIEQGEEVEENQPENEQHLPEIDEIPSDWNLVTVEDVSQDLIGGGTPSKSNEEYWGGAIPWASVKDLDGIELAGTEDYITGTGVENSATNIAPKNSIVISTRMTVGEPFINRVDMAINQDMKAIIPDTKQANPLFLVYSLWDKDPYLKSLGRGTTVDGITTRDLSLTHLELPELKEQHKIATILYTVDQAIQKTEEIIEQSWRVKKGLVQNLMSGGVSEHSTYDKYRLGPIDLKKPENWEMKSFGEFSFRVQDGPHITPDYVDEGIPFVSSQNVNPFRENFDYSEYEKYISKETYKEINQNCRPEKGDLIISRRATIGPTQLIRHDEQFGFFVGVAIIKTNDTVHNPFLEQLMNWSVMNKLWHLKSPGSTMKTLNLGTIKQQKIPLPPLQEQKEIAEILRNQDNKIANNERYNESLERLKQGLLQDLLSGKVRTTDTNIEIPDKIAQHG